MLSARGMLQGMRPDPMFIIASLLPWTQPPCLQVRVHGFQMRDARARHVDKPLPSTSLGASALQGDKHRAADESAGKQRTGASTGGGRPSSAAAMRSASASSAAALRPSMRSAGGRYSAAAASPSSSSCRPPCICARAIR